MAPAAPVWGVALRPSSLTIGRALILLAAAMLSLDWYLAPRPRPRLPRAPRLLIVGVAAVWVWTAANAAAWGCGTCGGDVYGLSELAAVCVLATVICAFEPALRSALVLSVLAGATLEAALALVGVHGLAPGTADTSAVQGRLAGTFGNPNELGIALAFGIPAGLAALRIQPARWRSGIIAALLLIVVALGWTLSRSGILAAAAGGAVVLVLIQPARSSRRRAVIAGLLTAAAVIGIGYPVFSSLRQHAESRPINPALKARDRSGWDAIRFGMVQAAGAGLANSASGELEVRTPRLGQGLSRAVGVQRAGGQYEVTFQARALSGSERLGYALQNGASLDVVTRQAVVSTRWRQLQVRWRPPADAKFARFYVWPTTPAAGFLLRDISAVARPPGATTASRFTLDTRLKGSFYAYLVAQRQEQQRREIDSRLFAVGASLSAFATQPLRGIGWGRFVSYSSAHGRYGDLPTHDEYLRFLAELGAIGALLLAFVVAVVAVAAWNGARNELGIAIAGMLATGALALVFINGLVAPDVMMPVAFAAAVACARAGVRPPVAREAGSWWPLPDRLRRGQPEVGQDQDPAANRDQDAKPDEKPARAPGPPSPPRGYRPALDGLRGVSVLTIIAYHMTTSVPGGFLAVDIFFVLSGYLITSILLRELLRKGRIRLAEFWARRARRLLPAVMLLVLVCAFQIYYAGDVSAWALRRSDLLGTLFYYANWHFIATDQSYFAGFLGASPVRHTWTLAIEEQFYLVWPLVVFGAYRLARSTRLLAGVIAAGIVASALAMVAVYSVENPSRAYFGTDARASSLLIGAGLALLVARRPGWLASARGGAIARWAALPIAATALAGFGLLSDTGGFYYHGGALIFAALVALAIFVVEAAPGGRMARALSFLPLRWTGQISYGLYLWYWPVLVWSSGWLPGDGLQRKLAELAVIYAAAATSYYVLERPIREGRLPGLGLSRRRLAVAIPILLAVVAAVTVRLTTLPTASLASQLAALTPLYCPQQIVAGSYSWCPRQIGKPGAPVVASIGDSTSQALYPGMREAAKRRGWTYIEAAEGGCSSLPLLFVQFDQPQYVARAKRCVAGVPQVIRGVRARYRPDVWVLTDRWPLATMVTRAGKPLAPTDPRRDALIEAALRSLLRQLTAGGAHVLFVPTPPPGEPVACALHKLATTICDNAEYSERDRSTAELTRIVRTAAAGLARVALVPITDVVCPGGGQCLAIIDGTVVRYDGIHYSGPFSRKLVPIILERAQRRGLSFALNRHE